MKNFIICLSKIESSFSTATKLKSDLELFGEDVEFFEGTYGTDAVKMMEEEGRVLHPFGFKGPNAVEEKLDPDHKLTKLTTPGVRGCFYSHYRLWKECVRLDEPIIIWEDDIKIYRPFNPVEWDDILVVSLGHPGKSQKYIDYLENPSGIPEAKDYHQASMPGCCGYAIKPHAAKKLLKTYKNTYLPADNAINQLHVKIQIHSHIMGTALLKKDGKRSLTRTNFWNDYHG
jgi:GR25 family glycosyltransferase involved in LPS biosynthesis